jgi:hypothetical protein
MAGADLGTGRIDRDCVFAECGQNRQVMARTKTEKLVLCGEKNPSLYFDLQADPLEMKNRFEDAGCQDAVKRLRDRIQAWRPPEKVTKVYLDESAPVIKAANVPDRNDRHREAISAYYAEKMRKLTEPGG